MSRTALSSRQIWRMQAQLWIIQHCFSSDKEFTMLDLGTEYGHTARSIRAVYPNVKIHGVEIHEPTYRACKEDTGDLYTLLHLGDAIKFLEGVKRRYSLIVAAEIIEHLSREDGFKLLQLIREKSMVGIVTSPVGFQAQGANDGNPHQIHVSGWNRKDIESVEGWKCFLTLHYGYSLGIYYHDRMGRL